MKDLETPPDQPAIVDEPETPPAADHTAPETADAGTDPEGPASIEQAVAEEAAAIEQLAIAEESASAGEPLPPDDPVAVEEPPAEIEPVEADAMEELPIAVEEPALSMDELLAAREPEAGPLEDSQLRAVLEAIAYVAEEP